MKRSTDRILTTHTGSLPRPDDLLAMLQAREQGKEKDTPAFYAQAARAVEEVVRAQVDKFAAEGKNVSFKIAVKDGKVSLTAKPED